MHKRLNDRRKRKPQYLTIKQTQKRKRNTEDERKARHTNRGKRNRDRKNVRKTNAQRENNAIKKFHCALIEATLVAANGIRHRLQVRPSRNRSDIIETFERRY